MKPTLLKKVAYHEAGHAVIAYGVRRAFSGLTTIPDDTYLGCCFLRTLPSFHPDYNSDRRTIRHIERLVLICYGGVMAEKLLFGRSSWIGARDDLELATTMAAYDSGSDEEVRALCKLMMIRCKQTLALPHNWIAVQRLAEALIAKRRLSYRAARFIIEAARFETPICAKCKNVALAVDPKAGVSSVTAIQFSPRRTLCGPSQAAPWLGPSGSR